MSKIFIPIAAFAICCFTAPTTAQEWEGERLAKLLYHSIDGSEQDAVNHCEFEEFGEGVFVSMDYDDSNTLSAKEFLNWGFGIQNVAAEAGRSKEYKAGMLVVFSLWDRDGDGDLTQSEYRKSLHLDFLRADANEDSSLSEKELTTGFSVFAASRATILSSPEGFWEGAE